MDCELADLLPVSKDIQRRSIINSCCPKSITSLRSASPPNQLAIWLPLKEKDPRICSTCNLAADTIPVCGQVKVSFTREPGPVINVFCVLCRTHR